MHHTLRESNKGNNTFSLPLFLHFVTLYFCYFQPRTRRQIVTAWGCARLAVKSHRGM